MVNEGGGPLLPCIPLLLSDDWLLLRAEDIQADSVCGIRTCSDDSYKIQTVAQIQWFVECWFEVKGHNK